MRGMGVHPDEDRCEQREDVGLDERDQDLQHHDEKGEHERDRHHPYAEGEVDAGHQGDEEEQAGNTAAAQAALSKAIQLYEEGFQRDPRDYYPGVNAVTLRIVRARPEDEAELKHLLPVVRFSVRRAPKPTELRPAEAYWQEATRLELACAERDWEAVPQHTEALLGLKTEPWMQPWMYKTTIGNLEKQRKARATEPDTVQHLEHTIQALS